MVNKVWYDRFLEALFKKYPQKSKLTEALMDLLSLEREAVYRRLRNDVVFPASEIIKIASAWNISLDEIAGVNSNEILFKTQLWNYLNPSEEELNYIRYLNEESEYVRNFPNVGYIEISNRIPRMWTSGFSYLRKFHLLKWMYQYTNEKTLPFSQIVFPKMLAELSSSYYRIAKNMRNVSFILDNNILSDLVSDIHYFQSVYLITDEEKELIKKDIFALLDYVWKIAEKGCWPETSNKVNLYISHLSIDTNYSYYYSDSIEFFCVHAFALSGIKTTNSVMVENFKNWMQSQKRASIQISEADERNRIEFFKKRRQLIDSL